MAGAGARRVRQCGASGAARRRDIGDGRTTVHTGWRTTHRSALYGPGGEPEIPSENSPHPSVLVGGVRQRRSCALGWYRPSVGVPRDVGRCALVVFAAYIFSVQFPPFRGQYLHSPDSTQHSPVSTLQFHVTSVRQPWAWRTLFKPIQAQLGQHVANRRAHHYANPTSRGPLSTRCARHTRSRRRVSHAANSTIVPADGYTCPRRAAAPAPRRTGRRCARLSPPCRLS